MAVNQYISIEVDQNMENMSGMILRKKPIHSEIQRNLYSINLNGLPAVESKQKNRMNMKKRIRSTILSKKTIFAQK